MTPARDARVQVAIDGVRVDAEYAIVSVFDRGFLYGDGVFETLRSYGGAIFRLEAHLERLAWSCEQALIELPLGLEELGSEVRELSAAMRANDQEDSAIRLLVTRGEGPLGLDPTECTRPRRVMFVSPLTLPPSEVYERGVTAVSSSRCRPCDALGGAKLLGYLPSIVAIAEAKRSGADEVILLSSEGNVLEGATSSLFAVLEGVLCTPPLWEGILPGITRAAVLELAASLAIPAEERRLTPSDLARAEEVFLSSSLRELVPVVSLDGFRIADGAVGPQTRRLLAALRALARPHAPTSP